MDSFLSDLQGRKDDHYIYTIFNYALYVLFSDLYISQRTPQKVRLYLKQCVLTGAVLGNIRNTYSFAKDRCKSEPNPALKSITTFTLISLDFEPYPSKL